MIRAALCILLAAMATHALAATEAELLAKAQAGDYWAQRNLAYGYATGDQRIRRDAEGACAWYLVVLGSGSTKVNEGDAGNVRVYCDRLDDGARQQAVRQAAALHRQIYGTTKR